jgi:membrane associated rhomboid family serine protease
MVLQIKKFVDKYLTIIIIFLIVSIALSFVSPATGEIREQPILPQFYGSIAGIIIIWLYSAFKERKKQQKDRAKRRSKK